MKSKRKPTQKDLPLDLEKERWTVTTRDDESKQPCRYLLRFDGSMIDKATGLHGKERLLTLAKFLNARKAVPNNRCAADGDNLDSELHRQTKRAEQRSKAQEAEKDQPKATAS